MTVRPIGATAGDVPLGRTVAISRWASFWRRNGTGYAFLTPWMLGFFLLTIGPALVDIKSKYPDRNELVAIVSDETKRNPTTVMPPFGRNHILTEQEINAVVDFLQTL